MVAYKWTVLTNTTMGALLASIDGTIVLISLPVIFRGLGVNPFSAANFPLLIWMLLGYGVVTATLLVSMGRLSDMLGRARMYNFGFAIFSTASVFLFIEPWDGTTGAWALVVLRLVQAVGAAFLFANSAALLTDAFPPNERGLALGTNQIAFIGGSLLGLIVGGVLASVPDLHFLGLVLPTWRLIFLVSVPVGVIGTIWAYAKLKEISVRRANQRIDLVGNATFAVSLVLILVSITYGLLPYNGAQTGWGDPWVWGGLIGGAGLLLFFLWVETRVADPMFHLGLFKVRSFAAGTSASFLGSLARGGMMLLLVLWLQGLWLPLHGYSLSETPLWAGILMTPMMGGFVVAGPLSGKLSDRHGARVLSTAGMALGSATFFALAFLPTDFQYWEMGVLLFAQGVGMGMFASPNAASVMNSVPPENRGAASGMLATLQNAGQQLSLAAFFTIVILGLSNGLPASASGALAGISMTPADAGILTHVISSDPSGALFGAFLGQNPLTAIVGTFNGNPGLAPPGWTPLTPTATAQVEAPHFFATAIGAAFSGALSEAFLFAGAVTALAAVISAMRGRRFVYGEQTPEASRSSAPPEAKPARPTEAGGATVTARSAK